MQPKIEAARHDFKGGLVLNVLKEDTNPDEVFDAFNVRFRKGYVTPRLGSQRIHTTAIGSGNPVRGVHQWQSPSGRQVVAIANGRFYHKTSATGEFTEIDPGASDRFSTTEPTFFASFRSASSGAALVLFMASAGKVYKWDGTTLTRIDGTTGVPTASFLLPYHTRMFYNNSLFVKHMTWSQIGDAEVCTRTGRPTDGGSAMVDVLKGDALVNAFRAGSSLLLATGTSISRLHGYSNDDITLAEDSEGLLSTVGLLNASAVANIEGGVGFFASNGRPYLLNETQAINIGEKLVGFTISTFGDLSIAELANALVGYNKEREEIWFAFDTTGETRVFVFSLEYQNWTIFVFDFTFKSLGSYAFSTTNRETLLAGCSDGFVRVVDFPDDLASAPIGMKDDVLVGGSGGAFPTQTSTFQFYVHDLDVNSTEKRLTRAFVRGSGVFSMTYNDGFFGTGVASSVTFDTDEDNRIDTEFHCERLWVTVTFGTTTTTTSVPRFSGILIKGYDYGRI